MNSFGWIVYVENVEKTLPLRAWNLQSKKGYPRFFLATAHVFGADCPCRTSTAVRLMALLFFHGYDRRCLGRHVECVSRAAFVCLCSGRLISIAKILCSLWRSISLPSLLLSLILALFFKAGMSVWISQLGGVPFILVIFLLSFARFSFFRSFLTFSVGEPGNEWVIIIALVDSLVSGWFVALDGLQAGLRAPTVNQLHSCFSAVILHTLPPSGLPSCDPAHYTVITGLVWKQKQGNSLTGWGLKQL